MNFSLCRDLTLRVFEFLPRDDLVKILNLKDEFLRKCAADTILEHHFVNYSDEKLKICRKLRGYGIGRYPLSNTILDHRLIIMLYEQYNVAGLRYSSYDIEALPRNLREITFNGYYNYEILLHEA